MSWRADMSGISVGELVKQAKGEDRSLREYARDSGVDAAILSKMINGTYLPKKPGIYEALTSPPASPRGGVTLEKMLEAAGATEDFQSGMSAGMSAGMLTALADDKSITGQRDSGRRSRKIRSSFRRDEAGRDQKNPADPERHTAAYSHRERYHLRVSGENWNLLFRQLIPNRN